MRNDSAVQFETNSRIHIALAVSSLEHSIAFYRTLFGQEPTKTRPGYAKFEVAEPPVNLAINAVGSATGPTNPVAHFGIQVKSSEAVTGASDRLRVAGPKTAVEENVACCHAVQNKVWVTDPDGNKWEVYIVLDNDAPPHASGGCCPGVDGVMAAIDRDDPTAAKGTVERANGVAARSCLKPSTRE